MFTRTGKEHTRMRRWSFPETYYLVYRDLPAIVAQHVTGREALDFGCGTGRSTRFLKRLGFNAIGIDISSSMIELAGEERSNGRLSTGRRWRFQRISALSV